MPVLDHWHPLLLSCDFGRKPVAARLGGREIALFRTASPALGDLKLGRFDRVLGLNRERLKGALSRRAGGAAAAGGAGECVRADRAMY